MGLCPVAEQPEVEVKIGKAELIAEIGANEVLEVATFFAFSF